ncbi:glucosamine-6-phosphate deaminase, partial [Patescibacteria group bacterium]
MNILVTHRDEFAKFAAGKIANNIIELQQKTQKDIFVVFASGNTMIDILHQLSENRYINWRRIQFFHLDEYKGLALNNRYSYAKYFQNNLFSKINIPKTNIHYINGLCPNYQDYQELLKHGADITILGIGIDGHLGFNEPGSSFNSQMRLVRLNSKTIHSNKNKYPQIANNPYAYTLGLADIFKSKKIFLFANTISKANIIKKALESSLSKKVPASILQKHKNVNCILGSSAASLLSIRTQ